MERRLRVSSALTAAANRGYTVALVVLVYHATGSPTWVAATAAGRYLAGLVAGALSGPIATRCRPAAVLVWTDLSGALALGGLAAAALTGAPVLLPVALGALVRAIASLQAASAAAMLIDVAVGCDIADAAARQNAVDKLALFGGPAVGGLLLLFMSPGVELALLAGFLGVAGVLATGLGHDARFTVPRPAAPPDAGALRVAPRGLAVVFALFSVASGLVYGTDTVVFAVLSHDRLNLGDAGYGVLFGALGVGGVAGSALLPLLTRTRHIATVLALGLAAYCLPTAVLVMTTNAGVAVGVEVVRGAAALLVEMLAITGLQRTVLPRDIPAAISATTAAIMGAVTLGAIATPIMLHSLGLTGTLLADGLAIPALAVASAPFLLVVDRHVERRCAELAPRVDTLAGLRLFTATSRPILERMAAALTEVTVGPGVALVVEGDVADAFWVLVEGEAEVTIASGAGERRVNVLSDGDWFGEIGLLLGRPRTATVTTTRPSRLLRLAGADLLDAFAQVRPSAGLVDGAHARLRASSELLSTSA